METKDKKEPFEASEVQIAEWKKKHGDVFAIESEDGKKRCYVRTPNRKELGAASTIMQSQDLVKYQEFLLNNIWLAGDEEMRNEDDYFFGCCAQLGEVCKVKEAKIKKL
jgi:hypothetical protein